LIDKETDVDPNRVPDIEQLPPKNPWLQAHMPLLRQLLLVGQGQAWSIACTAPKSTKISSIMIILD
jgi:hypothetical protein